MKNILKNYIKFYKENLRKKHVVCTVISILIFIIFLFSNIMDLSKINETIEYTKVPYFTNLKENLLLIFIIIFAGITPYCFLSVLGFSGIYNIALKVAYMYVSSGNILLLIVNCLVSIIIAISYSLCIASGIHYCVLSSQKFTYSQKKGFNFKDFKASLYRLRKDEEKLRLYEEEKVKQAQKIEKLNVKVPYLNLAISFIISTVMLVITSIII